MVGGCLAALLRWIARFAKFLFIFTVGENTRWNKGLLMEYQKIFANVFSLCLTFFDNDKMKSGCGEDILK